MKTPKIHLHLVRHKSRARSDAFSPEHSRLNGTLVSQRRPQDLFTNAQLFPSMLPDDSKAMSGRSHQIEG